MSTRETYDIEIAGLKRSLRLFEIKPGLKIPGRGFHVPELSGNS